ncbi:MAG: ferredoxin [Planctomycetes bacterium]|nr:ferredoxin [Planctomycetota bacterium]
MRRFALGDPAARQSFAAPSSDALPALLANFRDPARLRSDFPAWAAIDGSTGAFACLPVSELLSRALDAAGGSARARVLADNLVRAERQLRNGTLPARREATGRDGAATLRPVGDALIDELGLATSTGEELRTQWAALCAATGSVAPGHGEWLDLDDDLPLRVLFAVVRAVVPARRRAFACEAARLAESLRALLLADDQKSPAARDATAQAGGLGATGAVRIDPRALARVVGEHRGTLRLGPARRARMESAWTVLHAHARDEEAPLLTIVHAHRDKTMPRDALLAVEHADDPCARAITVFHGYARRVATVCRAVRLAELELAGGYEQERHDAWLDAFDVRSFTRDELLLVPAVAVVAHGTELSGAAMTSLSRLLASAHTVQVLALVDPLGDPAGDPTGQGTAFDAHRLELGYLGIGHREAFVQQSAAARPAHLAAGLRAALDVPRPALHVVATTGVRAPAVGAWLYGGASIEGRAHPLFRYDPCAGATWARRFDLAGNPSPETDWSGTPPFTFADFALLDPAFANEFAVVPDSLRDDAALVPIAELLARDDAAAAHAVAVIDATTADGRTQRLAVSRRLVDACRDRLAFWRTLEELAGVRNEYVREAVARAQADADARVQRETERLAAEHADELARVRAAAVDDAMHGLARSLLELGPANVASEFARAPAPAAPPNALASVAPATAPAPVAPPAATPAPIVEEAWIDTPLCTSCNDCRAINPLVFVYDANKQARLGDASAGTYEQLVRAAEKCPARCIHPGLPRNPQEPGLDALIARAAPFNR